MDQGAGGTIIVEEVGTRMGKMRTSVVGGAGTRVVVLSTNMEERVGTRVAKVRVVGVGPV